MITTALKRCKHWIESHRDVLFDAIRLALGLFIFAKGLQFAAHRDQLGELMADSGPYWFASAVIGHYVLMAHLAGGAFLVLGLLTRWAALAQIPILLGAIFIVHMPHVLGLQQTAELEVAAVTLFLLVLTFLHGAGRFSLDGWLERKSRELEAHTPWPYPHVTW